MSKTELKKLHLIQKHLEGLMTLNEVALALGLSLRQVKRIKKGVVEKGPASLPHGNRGRKPIHALPAETVEQVVSLASTVYQGFNYHHLRDLLEQRHNICLSVSSVRRILLQHNIKSPKKRRPAKKYRNRPRRSRLGELIQIDASPFLWLGEGHPMTSLVAAIDDATGMILGATFRPHEDFWGYAQVMFQVISMYGIPENVYSDRHTIFQSPKAERLSIQDELAGIEVPLTRFGKCLESLDVIHTLARSPQAKGRIERLWETLQDRLSKELALAKIDSIDAANDFLPEFIRGFNAKFAIEPSCKATAFRPSPTYEELLIHLAKREPRKVDNGSSISLKGRKMRLIDSQNHSIPLKRGTVVTVISDLEGNIRALYQDKVYDLCPCDPNSQKQEPIAQKKTVGKSKPCSPAANHPWKRWNPDYFHYHPTTDMFYKGTFSQNY